MEYGGKYRKPKSLVPCKKCGCTKIQIYFSDKSKRRMSYKCTNCGAYSTPVLRRPGKSKSQARRQWQKHNIGGCQWQ